MPHQNRNATAKEMSRARRVIREAFPEYEPVFGGHSAYGGHRAPRDHTISFRLRDSSGRFHSNVVWLMPDQLATLTTNDVQSLVDGSNG